MKTITELTEEIATLEARLSALEQENVAATANLAAEQEAVIAGAPDALTTATYAQALQLTLASTAETIRARIGATQTELRAAREAEAEKEKRRQIVRLCGEANEAVEQFEQMAADLGEHLKREIPKLRRCLASLNDSRREVIKLYKCVALSDQEAGGSARGIRTCAYGPAFTTGHDTRQSPAVPEMFAAQIWQAIFDDATGGPQNTKDLI